MDAAGGVLQVPKVRLEGVTLLDLVQRSGAVAPWLYLPPVIVLCLDSSPTISDRALRILQRCAAKLVCPEQPLLPLLCRNPTVRVSPCMAMVPGQLRSVSRCAAPSGRRSVPQSDWAASRGHLVQPVVAVVNSATSFGRISAPCELNITEFVPSWSRQCRVTDFSMAELRIPRYRILSESLSPCPYTGAGALLVGCAG